MVINTQPVVANVLWKSTSVTTKNQNALVLLSILADKDSRQIQARHYKTLQEMCKKAKPNQEDVSQLLDLEFEARRSFIDSDTMKEENRARLILDAYPCFKELHHVSFWKS